MAHVLFTTLPNQVKMCGIAGIIDFNRQLGPEALKRMARAMSAVMDYRGPDSDGVWIDTECFCAFSHRRLSIIDTSDAGRQPMESWDRRYCITYNGEIYNFQELKPELEALGHTFRTKTDTEVLIEELRNFGTDAFNKIDGMYAFAFFDRNKKELLLGRDPFGEKPLYYLSTPSHFAFASELHALQTLPFFDDSISIDALAEYLSFQYIGAPRTLYKSVKKVPPGHHMIVRSDGSQSLHRYFSFNPGRGEENNRTLSDLADELEDILLRSIKRRLISDVPLGAFLSGGVDSSTVVALIRKVLKEPIKTFSVGFAGTEETEHMVARRFADHLGTEHYEKILTPDASSFLHQIGGILDEPNGDSSCLPVYLLSKFAREKITVAISGDGGDEMFGGYDRYFYLLNEEKRYKSGDITAWSPGNAYFSPSILFFTEEHIRELLGHVPDGFMEILDGLRKAIDRYPSIPLLHRMRRADVENYLPGAVLAKEDRMSMQHSLEVRTPFLNVEVARFAEKLPAAAMVAKGAGKRVLREIAYRYLPAELVDLPKRGFGLPMTGWGRVELLQTTSSLIETKGSSISTCFGHDGIERFMQRQRTEEGFMPYQLWALSVLESYLRKRPVTLPSPRVEISCKLFSQGRKWVPTIAQEFQILLKFLKLGQPVYVFCKDGIPPYSELMPRSSAVISPLPFEDNGRIRILRYDWLNKDFDWIKNFSKDLPEKAMIWFYSNNSDGDMPDSKLKMLANAGFKHLVISSPERNSVRVFPLKNYLFRKRMGQRIPKVWLTLFGQQLIEGGENENYPYSIIEDGGNCYNIQFRNNATEDKDDFSSFVLFEDGVPLSDSNSWREEIRKKGVGRHGVWMNHIYFSSSDNTNPAKNGRSYHLFKKTFLNKLLCKQSFCEAPGLVEEITEDVSQKSFKKNFFKAILEDNASYLDAEAKPVPGSRIALITSSLSAGGAERQWCCLARKLDEMGFKVTLIVQTELLNEHDHYLSMLRRSSVEVVSVKEAFLNWDFACLYDVIQKRRDFLLQNIPYFLRSDVLNLFICLQHIKPQFVACQLDYPNIIGGITAWLAGIPKILLSFRNVNPSNFDHIYQPWFRDYYIALAKSRRVILSGNSRFGNDDYSAWLGIPKNRVVLIQNGLNPDLFRSLDKTDLKELRNSLGLDPATPVICGVFRLSEEKAPFLFLEVVQKIHKKMPELQVLLVGEGPLKDELGEKIEKMGLGNVVQMLGRRNDIFSIMSVSSLLLCTSKHEGTPNVILEAQYLKLPVIAARVGGVSEALQDGISGFLCDLDSVDQMAERSLFLLNHEEKRKAMGKAGHRFVVDRYSMDGTVKDFLSALTIRR